MTRMTHADEMLRGTTPSSVGARLVIEPNASNCSRGSWAETLQSKRFETQAKPEDYLGTQPALRQ